jgi:hypothetical protein
VSSVNVVQEGEKSESMLFVVRKDEVMPATIQSQVETIVQLVHAEFGTKAHLFQHVLVRMDTLSCPEFEATKVAGVYVFIHEESGCLKVGKSQSNASKRALQHCSNDNTSSKDGTIQMAQLRQSKKTYMLIFALQKPESVHWLLSGCRA